MATTLRILPYTGKRAYQYYIDGLKVNGKRQRLFFKDEASALQVFAGLRTAEVLRLEWSDLDLIRGFIIVTAHKPKRARRRLIPIAENLAEWLSPYVQLSGPVYSTKLEIITPTSKRAEAPAYASHRATRERRKRKARTEDTETRRIFSH